MGSAQAPDKFTAVPTGDRWIVRTNGAALLNYDKQRAIEVAVELNNASYEQQQLILAREWNR